MGMANANAKRESQRASVETRITLIRIDVSRVVVVGKMNQTQALGENLRRALALDAAA